MVWLARCLVKLRLPSKNWAVFDEGPTPTMDPQANLGIGLNRTSDLNRASEEPQQPSLEANYGAVESPVRLPGFETRLRPLVWPDELRRATGAN